MNEEIKFNSMFHAIIIEESLIKPEIFKNYKILRTKFEPAEGPGEIDWHLHIVEIPEPEKAIKEFQMAMASDQPYYFHIYNECDTLIIVFKDKIFNLDPNNESTWKEARAFGASKLNIPAEQLDFYPTRVSEENDWFNR